MCNLYFIPRRGIWSQTRKQKSFSITKYLYYMSFRGSIDYLYICTKTYLWKCILSSTPIPRQDDRQQIRILASPICQSTWYAFVYVFQWHPILGLLPLSVKLGFRSLMVNDNHRISQTGESYLIATYRAIPEEKEMGAGWGSWTHM